MSMHKSPHHTRAQHLKGEAVRPPSNPTHPVSALVEVVDPPQGNDVGGVVPPKLGKDDAISESLLQLCGGREVFLDEELDPSGGRRGETRRGEGRGGEKSDIKRRERERERAGGREVPLVYTTDKQAALEFTTHALLWSWAEHTARVHSGSQPTKCHRNATRNLGSGQVGIKAYLACTQNSSHSPDLQ